MDPALLWSSERREGKGTPSFRIVEDGFKIVFNLFLDIL